jgi:thymidylate synthase (FAD)
MSFSSDMMKIRHPVGRYIRNLIDKGHESVLEHVAWTFIIDQISRSFTHQLVRHRVGLSYSQLSQQYHEEDAATFVEPLVLQDNPQIRAQWLQSVRASKDTYRAILAALSKLDPVPDPEATRKIRSAARSVLPNATTTTIAVTANCRALRHLFRTRGDILGDSEMRSVVIAMYELVLDDAPALFPDFKLATTPDGVGALKHFPAGGS